jgi:hypothetical protein
MALGSARSCPSSAFGSRNTQPRASASAAIAALYCVTARIKFVVSATETTCGIEQSRVVGTPADAWATSGAP